MTRKLTQSVFHTSRAYRKTFRRSRSSFTLRRNLYTQENIAKYCVQSISCSCDKNIYKAQTSHPIKAEVEENRKVVVRRERETIKSSMADYVYKDKGNHQPLWNKMKILVWEPLLKGDKWQQPFNSSFVSAIKHDKQRQYSPTGL